LLILKISLNLSFIRNELLLLPITYVFNFSEMCKTKSSMVQRMMVLGEKEGLEKKSRDLKGKQKPTHFSAFKILVMIEQNLIFSATHLRRCDLPRSRLRCRVRARRDETPCDFARVLSQSIKEPFLCMVVLKTFKIVV
jgi:hypothetical protein